MTICGGFEVPVVLVYHLRRMGKSAVLSTLTTIQSETIILRNVAHVINLLKTVAQFFKC
jgi:hypothetical protein